MYLQQWKWSEAAREYERAIELNPNYRGAREGYAFYLAMMGRHAESVAEAKHAIDIDPVSNDARARLALCLHNARRFDESIKVINELIEAEPARGFYQLVLGYNLAGKGMHREAIKAYGDPGQGSSSDIFIGAAYANAGERAKAIEILNQLRSNKEYVSPGELPVLLAALGDKEAAFASFEKAFESHDLQLMYLKVDPAFDPLRNDPRFADLIRRVGLPE